MARFLQHINLGGVIVSGAVRPRARARAALPYRGDRTDRQTSQGAVPMSASTSAAKHGARLPGNKSHWSAPHRKGSSLEPEARSTHLQLFFERNENYGQPDVFERSGERQQVYRRHTVEDCTRTRSSSDRRSRPGRRGVTDLRRGDAGRRRLEDGRRPVDVHGLWRVLRDSLHGSRRRGFADRWRQ